jgi:hypothetical protein
LLAVDVEADLCGSWGGTGSLSLRGGHLLEVSDLNLLVVEVKGPLHVKEL